MHPKKNRKSSKSQISAEFIIVTAILMIIFISFFAIANKRASQSDSIKAMLYAKTEADKVANAINSAFIAGDNSKIVQEISGTFRDGSPYMLSIYPASRIVDITYKSQGEARHYSTSIITSQITGNLTGINSTITISNHDKVISVEK